MRTAERTTKGSYLHLCSKLRVAQYDILPFTGISFAPTLPGKSEQKRHEFLYLEFHERGGSQAIRLGDWKAIRLGIMNRADSPIELYDLAHDIAEKENVAATHPDIVAKMATMFVRERTPAKNFPTPLDKLK